MVLGQPIRPVGVRPQGDDQKWKKEVERVLNDLIKDNVAAETRIQRLEQRVR